MQGQENSIYFLHIHTILVYTFLLKVSQTQPYIKSKQTSQTEAHHFKWGEVVDAARLNGLSLNLVHH